MSLSMSPRQIAEQKQKELLAEITPRLRTVIDEITEIDRQISRLRDKRVVLAAERGRLKKLIYETPTFEQRDGPRQELFVRAEYFLPYIEQWIYEYNAMNGSGGRTMLARRSGISMKSIRRYFNGSVTYAGVLSVDRLFTAMGKPHLMEEMPTHSLMEIKIFGRNPSTPEPPTSQYYEE